MEEEKIFGFSKNTTGQNSVKSESLHILTLQLKQAEITKEKFGQYNFVPKLVIGFVSPALDFNAISTKLKQILPSNATLLLSTTAGELCSMNNAMPLSNLYSQADAGTGDNIVLMMFDTAMIEDVFVATIPLKSETITVESTDMRTRN